MGANISASVFNTFALAFFVVVVIGVALGAYAAIQMKKMEDKIKE